jgi:hypothetical protein
MCKRAEEKLYIQRGMSTYKCYQIDTSAQAPPIHQHRKNARDQWWYHQHQCMCALSHQNKLQRPLSFV